MKYKNENQDGATFWAEVRALLEKSLDNLGRTDSLLI
jgi:hypothetical protein